MPYPRHLVETARARPPSPRRPAVVHRTDPLGLGKPNQVVDFLLKLPAEELELTIGHSL